MLITELMADDMVRPLTVALIYTGLASLRAAELVLPQSIATPHLD